MDVFGADALIGDYRLSDHGLMLVTFNFEETRNIGTAMSTNEQFLGKNARPVYLGSSFNSKLRLTATVMQDWRVTGKTHFTVQEIREILGRLTGFQGYKKMYVYSPSNTENMYYNVRVDDDVEYEMSGDKVVAIKLPFDCDSQFAWVDCEMEYTTTENDSILYINNTSDEYYDYLKPIITITSENAVNGFTMTNLTDNDRETEINEVKAGETITIDSRLNKITSSMNTNFSEIFNYKFPRLVVCANNIQVSHPVTIRFNMTIPRKVGMIP